jgi:hypothetical protein
MLNTSPRQTRKPAPMQTVTAASITAAAYRMRRLRTCRRLLDTDEAGVSGERFKYWDSSITESERIRISSYVFLMLSYQILCTINRTFERSTIYNGRILS